MCSNFIEAFTNKIVEKTITCKSCKECRTVCKIPTDFNYLQKDICDYLVRDNDWYVYDNNIEIHLDLLYSFLHNLNYEKFLSLLTAIRQYDSTLLPIINEKVKKHKQCIDVSKIDIDTTYNAWISLPYLYFPYKKNDDCISFEKWLDDYLPLINIL